ncbi:MAG: hypothetical protein ACJ8J0_19685 [Longimicrobiaceae bacterium]
MSTSTSTDRLSRRARRKRRGAEAAVALLLAGCTHGGTATLRPVCAPTDAGAVMLEVPAGRAEYPRFRLRIPGAIREVAGQRVTVSQPDSNVTAYADWCDGRECRVVRPGPTTAAFGSLRPDSSVRVELRTTRPDGTPFTWRGVAPWHGERLICG